MDLLFKPRDGVEFKSRKEVPLLKVEYCVFVAALNKVFKDWFDGKIGIGQPTEDWEKKLVAEVNDLVNTSQDKSKDGSKLVENQDLVNQVYEELIKIKVPGHLKIVTSHRKWLRMSFEFLEKIGAKFSNKMAGLVRVHDLSKYTHREVLGYAVMFGDGSIDWRHLELESEKTEWENTLYNHYAGNPHHPEYFYPLKPDGSRDRSIPVLELDPVNGEDFIDESLIDMLAARGERNLEHDEVFNVKKWMNIPVKFMFRYAEGDRKFALRRLDEFKSLAQEYLSTESNANGLKGFFDYNGRPERGVAYMDYEENN